MQSMTSLVIFTVGVFEYQNTRVFWVLNAAFILICIVKNVFRIFFNKVLVLKLSFYILLLPHSSVFRFPFLTVKVKFSLNVEGRIKKCQLCIMKQTDLQFFFYCYSSLIELNGCTLWQWWWVWWWHKRLK